METNLQNVKNALINQRANELYQYSVALALGDSTVENLLSLNVRDETKAILLREFAREVTPQLEKQTLSLEDSIAADLTELQISPNSKAQLIGEFYREVSPNLTAKNIFFPKVKGFARNQLMSYAQVKKMLYKLNLDSKNSTHLGYEPLLEYGRINDSIVERLAEIAKEEGLEKILDPQVQSEVIREIFPTKNDYLNHLHTGLAYLEKLNQTISELELTTYAFPNPKSGEGIVERIVSTLYPQTLFNEAERRYIEGTAAVTYKDVEPSEKELVAA
ncbi:Uncharacterised protein [uncultured archaeon]|nr:Uncharacterised protein [uncultured archaeon]